MASAVGTRSDLGRQSSSASFLGTPAFPSGFESSRTRCPRDTDAFSYDPAYLKAWYMPQDLWDDLPSNLRKPLAAFQHAGAAVLTGFERLAAMKEDLPSITEHLDLPGSKEANDDDDGESVTARFFKVECQSSSNISVGEREEYLCCTPINPSPGYAQSSRSVSSNGSDSPASTSRSNSSCNSSPQHLALSPSTPVSPFTLSPSSPTTALTSQVSRRLSTSNFAHHHSAPTAQYLAELHHLRHEMLVRLRHVARRVEAEWREAQRVSTLVPVPRPPPSPSMTPVEAHADTPATAAPATARLQSEFDRWWLDKTAALLALTNEANELARGLDFGLGWGGHGGVGWA